MALRALAGDTQALPGYVSFYLQLQDPNLISNHRWDCFASYTLAVLNSADGGADLSRESWHRFSSRPARQQTRPLSSSSHGWADFTSAAQVQLSAFCASAKALQMSPMLRHEPAKAAMAGQTPPGSRRRPLSFPRLLCGMHDAIGDECPGAPDICLAGLHRLYVASLSYR